MYVRAGMWQSTHEAPGPPAASGCLVLGGVPLQGFGRLGTGGAQRVAALRLNAQVRAGRGNRRSATPAACMRLCRNEPHSKTSSRIRPSAWNRAALEARGHVACRPAARRAHSPRRSAACGGGGICPQVSSSRRGGGGAVRGAVPGCGSMARRRGRGPPVAPAAPSERSAVVAARRSPGIRAPMRRAQLPGRGRPSQPTSISAQVVA